MAKNNKIEGIFGDSVTLIKRPAPPAEGKKPTDLQLFQADLVADQSSLLKLLPIATIELTADEKQQVQLFQTAQLILGPAAAAPMTCSKQCPPPIRNTCPLAAIEKEPIGKKCPFEQQYVAERFLGWLKEIGRTTQDVLESERGAIATLAVLDLQERRCNAILADAENADLTSRSVRDVDAETGLPIAWEDVIHMNAVRMNEIDVTRRRILRDLELTPEMKTKRAKALGALKQGTGQDLATRQSDTADKLRRAQRGELNVIDV